MKIANYITFSRILGALLIPALLILEIPRIYTFFLYITFALTDVLDGFISRLRKDKPKETDGDIFDPVADKALFICTLTVLIGVQDIPNLASSIIVLREIMVLGLRASAERHGFQIKSSISAKLKTLAGNVAVSAYILKDEYFGISAQFVGDVSFVLCFALAVASGAQYITTYIKEIQKIKNTSLKNTST